MCTTAVIKDTSTPQIVRHTILSKLVSTFGYLFWILI